MGPDQAGSRIHLVRTEADLSGLDGDAAAGRPVGLPGVLAELSRRARPVLFGGRLLGRAVRRAFTWDAADRRDHTWWPQGITTSADATDEGRAWGRRLLLISWYSRADAGSRVSVVDLDTLRYEHVLLVVLESAGGAVRLEPLRVHAGGLAWVGEHLHVAATRRGLMTCRLDDVRRADVLGHRFVLPVRHSYAAATADGQEALRYSFVSLDRSADPVHLVVGEYGGAGRSHRLARYLVEAATGLLLEDEQATSRPLGLEEGGVVRAQGAVTAHGRWYVTASNGPWGPGTVHAGTPGAWRAHRWATPMGPEDVAWWPEQDRLWSLSEHPRRRWVFAMDRAWFDR